MQQQDPSTCLGLSATAPGRLRILQVVPTYYPSVRYGGPISTVRGLTAALARRGHDVHVYTTNVDGAENLQVPLAEPVTMDGAAVHYFPVPALKRFYWSPAMRTSLVKSMHDFDIVHLHSMFLWPCWMAARTAHRSNVPYLISPHGMLVQDLIHRKSRWAKTAWLQLMDRRSLQRAAGLHVTSAAEARDAAALGLPLPEIHNILHGTEWPDRHAPLAEGPFADLPRPYALFLSRLSWKKGLDRLIKAWQSVPELHLVIAGNDDESYLHKLKSMARAAGVADRLHFVGFASDTDKWALYENAEMFVLPSYNENFGCVVAEAMSMSCPVIVSSEVGLAPLVLETGAGIVTSGEPQALAEAVRSLHHDPARREEMGRRGRIGAIERLSWEAVAEEMEVVYRSLACGTRATAN